MDVAALLEAQSDVVRIDQLQAAGLTRGVLRAQLDAARWRMYGPLVVVAHNGPLSRRQACWAAVVAGGPRTRLAGLTALEVAGLTGWSDRRIHVLHPRGTSWYGDSSLGVVVHETRLPIPEGRVLGGFPPSCALERAAIDAASWSRDNRSAAALLAAVVQQRLTTAARLRSRLEAAGRIRKRSVLRLTLADIAGGADALSEIDFVRLCRRYGVGRVDHQVIRNDKNGRRRYIDGAIVDHLGRSVKFEVDGGIHLVVGTYWADMYRQNELVIGRAPVLRFSSYAVRWESDVVMDQLRRALEAQ
jgi:hypothetical protein